MRTQGMRAVIALVFLAGLLSCAAGCQKKKLVSTAKAVKAAVTSPKLVSIERTVYDIGPAKWMPWSLSAGLYQGKPIVAYRSAQGLMLAIASEPLPQSNGNWQLLLLDPEPTAKFINLAVADEGVFIGYMAGSRESTRLQLASCSSSNLADIQSWEMEDLPDSLEWGTINSIAVIDGWLGIACRQRETGQPLCLWRELDAERAEWQVETVGDIQVASPDLRLLDIDNSRALGYLSEDHTTLGLLLASSQESNEWRNTLLPSDTGQYTSQGCLDFAAWDQSACAVFHRGRVDPGLYLAVSLNANAVQPDWQVCEIVHWGMIGQPKVLFSGGLPVIAYEAEDALWAFFATKQAPAGFRDWRMCQLSENLGKSGFNGIEGLIIGSHLLVVYLETDAVSGTALGVTLIEIPQL